MKDADLLDLLEILGDMNEAIGSLADGLKDKHIDARISTNLARRKIDSFRSAIRQRMNHQQGEV